MLTHILCDLRLEHEISRKDGPTCCKNFMIGFCVSLTSTLGTHLFINNNLCNLGKVAVTTTLDEQIHEMSVYLTTHLDFPIRRWNTCRCYCGYISCMFEFIHYDFMQNKCERATANKRFILYKSVICELLPAYISPTHFMPAFSRFF